MLGEGRGGLNDRKAIMSLSPAESSFDSSQFRGVHWSRLGDNFTFDRLVLQGLSAEDTHITAKAEAGRMFEAFERTLGANTARLPVNPATATTDWWDTYTGVIDAGIERGFRIVLSYWGEDDTHGDGGRIPDLSTWNQMWDVVTSHYLSEPQVYFSLMNEPAYAVQEWVDMAAQWLVDRPSVPRNRVFIDGVHSDFAGPANDLRPLCEDERLDGTYLGMHLYGFHLPYRAQNEWISGLKAHLGNAGPRAVVEEFGARADTGIDFNDPAATDREASYLRAVTDTLRELNMGSIWCHVIGGRTTSPDHDELNILRLHSNTANFPLWMPNVSAVDRLKHAWGVE